MTEELPVPVKRHESLGITGDLKEKDDLPTKPYPKKCRPQLTTTATLSSQLHQRFKTTTGFKLESSTGEAQPPRGRRISDSNGKSRKEAKRETGDKKRKSPPTAERKKNPPEAKRLRSGESLGRKVFFSLTCSGEC